MGHYASEMSGPGLSKEDSLRILEEKKGSLQSTWKNSLRMAVEYPFSDRQVTCPRCFVLVQQQFVNPHDQWHNSIINQMTDIARWTSPGLIG